MNDDDFEGVPETDILTPTEVSEAEEQLWIKLFTKLGGSLKAWTECLHLIPAPDRPQCPVCHLDIFFQYRKDGYQSCWRGDGVLLPDDV